MSMERDGKIYRNLEEQVLKNMEDIATLQTEIGTQVVANPEEEATDDLTKVKIDNTVYQVSSDDAVWGNITGTLADQTDLKNALDEKQNALTAGSNININDGVISAVDTTYSNLPAASGGTDVSLVTTGEKYNWNNKQNQLTAGANITIVDNVISATGVLSSVIWGQIGGSLADQTDLKNALDAKQDLIDSSHKLPASNVSGLATVATSGDYNDLTNKPTIPAAQIQSDYTQSDNTAVDYIKNKPDLSIYAQSANLATVATSGNYNDLSNKPTIPAAQIQSDYAQSDNTQVDYIKNKPDLSIYAQSANLATVATTGSYNDLSNKPTIPAAVSGTNDGTNWTSLTIGNQTYGLAGGGSSYTAGTGIDITNDVISIAYPSIIILEAGD